MDKPEEINLDKQSTPDSLKNLNKVNDEINKFQDLTLIELNALISTHEKESNLEPFEIEQILKLVKQKEREEIERKFEDLKEITKETDLNSIPPFIVEKKGLVLPVEAVTSGENGNGYKKMQISELSDGTIAISKESTYRSGDWIGLYNYPTAEKDQFISYWWAGNYGEQIKTGEKRDRNREYYAKYWRDGSVIDQATLPSDGLFIKLEGGLGEELVITWSNSSTSSGKSYVALHNSSQKEPTNPKGYLKKYFKYANQDNGVFRTGAHNRGQSYIAVFWAAVDDGYRSLTSARVGPEPRHLAFIEVRGFTTDNDFKVQNDTKLGIRWRKDWTDENDYVIFSENAMGTFNTHNYTDYYWTKYHSEDGYAKTEFYFTGEDSNYRAGYCNFDDDMNDAVVNSAQPIIKISDYSSWMAKYWDKIATKRLRDLVLPGSHDSGTYGITYKSTVAPDWGSWSPTNNIIANWSLTQSRSIYHQLLWGIRYFDIRVAPNPSDYNNLWIMHNMFSIPVTEVLDDFARFSKSRPREIYIVHINHLQFLNDAQHQAFISLIKARLGKLLAEKALGSLATCSHFEGTPIILIYDETENKGDHISSHSDIWPKESIISHYDEDQFHSAEEVIEFGRQEIKADHSNKFWVLQSILTIDVKLSTLPKLGFSSLYGWTWGELDKFTSFFEELANSSTPTNIIITDFVTHYPLTEYCIRRNLK